MSAHPPRAMITAAMRITGSRLLGKPPPELPRGTPLASALRCVSDEPWLWPAFAVPVGPVVVDVLTVPAAGALEVVVGTPPGRGRVLAVVGVETLAFVGPVPLAAVVGGVADATGFDWVVVVVATGDADPAGGTSVDALQICA